MSPEPQSHDQDYVLPPPRKNSFWRKLGGGSLTISIIFHAVLLAVFTVWIIRIIPPEEEKKVDFMPTGGGGGSSASADRRQQKNRATISKPTISRISVAGVSSSITLPEMDDSHSLTSLGGLASSMSGGLGGSGSGGGRGTGTGKGFGDGSGIGAGIGGGIVNPFGMADPNANALEGVFYDFKQSKGKRQTEINSGNLPALYAEFTNKGWREASLNKYFKADRKLYQTKIYMPLMSAAAAPAAFQVEKDVEPKCWMVLYRGMVIAPKTGRFRFVGVGDDVMVVRFNGTNVFDFGYVSGTTAISMGGLKTTLASGDFKTDAGKIIKKDYPLKTAISLFKYPTTRLWNSDLGGMAAGVEFDVVGGRAYPLEILISEVYGGAFCAGLLIQEMGANYQTTPEGSPILPLFRTDHSKPEQQGDNAPPYDPSGPVWRVQKSGGIGF